MGHLMQKEIMELLEASQLLLWHCSADHADVAEIIQSSWFLHDCHVIKIAMYTSYRMVFLLEHGVHSPIIFMSWKYFMNSHQIAEPDVQLQMAHDWNPAGAAEGRQTPHFVQSLCTATRILSNIPGVSGNICRNPDWPILICQLIKHPLKSLLTLL